MCSCHPAPPSAINHSYYTGNSFSASHSVLQLQNDGTANSVQPLTHTQQANGAASSGPVSSPPLPCSTNSSQVPVCPIRNVTGDVMPLAQAITQLSFLEFLQHCGVPLAPPQPFQLPVPISLLDAAVQTNPPGDVFQDVSTQTSDQQDSSLSFDVAVQTSSHGIHILSLDAAVQTTSPSTLSQHVSTQMGSRLASSFSVDVFVQTLVRSVVLHDVAIQLPITEFFIGCVFSNDPLDCQNCVRQSPSSVHGPRALLHRQDSNSSPRLLVPLSVLTCIPYMAHLLQLHLYELGYVQLFQLRLHSSLLVPLMRDHIIYVQPLQAREVPVHPWWERTILLIQMHVQGLFLFLNRMLSFFLWSTLVNPNLKGTLVLIQVTAISCIINFVFLSFNGIQARRAEILLTLFPLPVVSIMQLFFKKPVITSHTSLSSSLCAPAIRILLSCSIKTPLSLTL